MPFTSDIASGGVSLLLAMLMSIGYWRFKVLLDDERLHLKAGRDLEASFWATWGTLLFFFLAAIMTVFQLLETIKPTFSIDAPAAKNTSNELGLLTGGALSIGFYIVAVWKL